MNKQQQIDELLSRGVDEVIDHESLLKKLRGGKKLRIKLGIDPTSPNIHIGRAIILWKLRAFQELGHQVVFLIGDFTGLIGDTSDKDSERPQLTEADVKKNMKDYFNQAFMILDKKKTETHYNSEWLKKIGAAELINLTNLFTLNEFQSRELIKRRVQAGKPVSMREAIYPVMQGYDSVAIKADVELGGTDQRFNMLAGRVIQKAYKQTPQDILTMQLLEGTDGRKMSSSWGNVVNLRDEPQDMFGKIMSINDSLIERYFLLATRVPLKEIEAVIIKNKNPRDQKLVLAESITALYHGDKKASEAREHFISQFSNKELPSDIPVVKITPGNYQLTELLLKAKLVASKSEARRLIEQKGVRMNGEVAESQSVIIGKQNNLLLQVGKRKFVTIK